jgi:diguanylate cyclase (GGDEF)-like protein/PAS domain S-box-containing protein
MTREIVDTVETVDTQETEMAETALCLACCPYLTPEVKSALGRFEDTDVAHAAFTEACLGRQTDRRRLRRRLETLSQGHEHVLAFGGSCLAALEREGDLPRNLSLRVFSDCRAPLADTDLLKSVVATGSYLVTAGWLRGWRRRIGTWGFDQQQERRFFQESCTQIVFLDAGVNRAAGRQAEALGEYLAIPTRKIPVSLDTLTNFLGRSVLEWRMDRYRGRMPLQDQDLQRQVADYAMALDLIGQLAALRSESEIQQGIADLMRLLFACSYARYVPVEEPSPSSEEYGDAPEHDAFWVKVGDPSRPMALLLAGDFAYPQYKSRYLDLTRTMARIFGLAISNARAYEQLARAQDRLSESEGRYRTLVSEAGEAMLVMDSQGVIVEANRRAVRILDAHADELLGQALADLVPRGGKKALRAALSTLNGENAIALTDVRLTRGNHNPPGLFDLTATALRLPDREMMVQAIIRDASARRIAEKQLHALSVHDELTGLSNRRGFNTIGPRQLQLASRLNAGIALFYIDLDGMKEVNDQLGHLEGDRALRATAAILRDTFRKSDLIARLGGDEFAVLMVLKTPDGSEIAARRLRSRVKRRNQLGDLPFSLELSVGVVSVYPWVEGSLESLIELADERMYEDKRSHKLAQDLGDSPPAERSSAAG